MTLKNVIAVNFNIALINLYGMKHNVNVNANKLITVSILLYGMIKIVGAYAKNKNVQMGENLILKNVNVLVKTQ